MNDKGQLKAQGLAFGRSLQLALKSVIMYSVEHPAADRALEASYASLNVLVKQGQQFTLGFLNQRVLLNNLLTEDVALNQLETEFAKRGIAAVSYEAGISLRDFKRTLALLSTKPRIIEEQGGIKRFLEQNPIKSVRILPAKKPGAEDHLVERSPESIILGDGLLDSQMGAGPTGLDLLFMSAGEEKPAWFTGSPGEILELAAKATQAALVDPQANPGSLYAALMQVLNGVKPQDLLASLPPEKQEELAGRPVSEVATDLVEDTAIHWAVKSLVTSPGGPESSPEESDAIKVLVRALETTRKTERLLNKLARFLEDANLSPEIYDRVQQGLEWYSLSQSEKRDRLMRLERFNAQDFRQLINFTKECLNESRPDEALQVVDHYFLFLDSRGTELSTELRRMPLLLEAIAGQRTLPLIRKLADRLGKDLKEQKLLESEVHGPLTNCLASMARIAATYEDFELVQAIGLDLEHSQSRDPRRHSPCCGKALEHLLTLEAVDRMIELCTEKRGEPSLARTVTALLKFLGPKGGERVFQRLEEETAGPNRMRLIRLITQIGPSAIELVRTRLRDERWYVVRNACIVAGDLGDPDLPHHLREPLRHADPRVQQAAVTALIKNHCPAGATVLAEALPQLHRHVLELALDELYFLKDPAAARGLLEYLTLNKGSKMAASEKAVHALAAISSEQAAEGLGKILSDPEQLLPIRRIALEALRQSPFPVAKGLLNEFARSHPSDPLAAEFQRLL
jgi:HEAT repeat protein